MPRQLLLSVLISAAVASCQCGDVRIGTVRPMIEARPASVDFGSTAPGLRVEQAVTLHNDSNAELTLTELSLTGEAASEFSLTQPDALRIEGGGDLDVKLTYGPNAAGNHSARLLVHSDASNAPELLIPLAGTAISADLCANVTCDTPPGPCFRDVGTCTQGSCTYLPKDDGAACDDGEACTEGDACRSGNCQGTPKACLTPPAPSCTGANSYVSYGSPGTCASGACQYPQTPSSCSGGCANDTCLPDPCASVTCNNPPACFRGGACVAGSCQYQVDLGASCNDGNSCTDGDLCGLTGVCAGTPKSCQTPPASSCLDAQTQRAYDSSGSCAGAGACNYPSHDTVCALGCDSATGKCRNTCPTGQHQCGSQCLSDTSVSSCGTLCAPCPVPINGAAGCGAGACGISCNQGYTPCGAGCCQTSTGAAQSVSLGVYHSCALTEAGGVKCWGSNTYGQLGDGTTLWRSAPVDVSGLAAGVLAVSAGGNHTCAITAAGGAKCWGYNYYGELGDGTVIRQTAPVDVIGLGSGVSALALGTNHTCALTTSGSVKCWGYNTFGQLGDGTTTARHTPVDVIGLSSGVAAIAAGWFHTCALTSAGGVQCWGNYRWGGTPTSQQDRTPAGVAGLASGIRAISAGAHDTCAITAAGGLKCWGYNASGEVGDGTYTERLSPVDVVGMASGVEGVAVGNIFTCAATSGGGAKCWGFNGKGQLGDGTANSRAIPGNVSTLTTGVKSVAAGGFHSCALMFGGHINCWGENSYSQLGAAMPAVPFTTTAVSVIGFP